MSMDTYTCPAEGCDYSGAIESVKAHYSGKRDDPHSGGYRVAADKLEDAEPSGEISVSDDVDEETEETDDSMTQSGTDPVMGDDEPEFNDGDMVELPCGHESFDASEAPDPPFEVSCESCGETFRVTEL